MIHIQRTIAGPLLAAALLSADAAAQDRIVRLPERDRPLAGTPAQVFAVGRADGAAHETFGEVSGVAFDAQDNLYVLDRKSHRVLVYDANGRFVRQFGAQGQGPGEFMAPMQLAVAGDGTIIVSDLGRRGYSLFRPDGTFLRNVLMEEWMPGLGGGIGWHPRGGIVSTARPALGPSRNGTTTQNVLPLLFQPVAGGQPTRLYDIPQAIRVDQQTSGPGQFNVRMRPPPMFSPPVLLGVIPNGQMALSFTPGYTVRILDARGQTVRYLQRPVRPRLTTEADRERARENQRESLASGRGMVQITSGGGGGGARPGLSRQDIERRLGEMEFADTIPALRALRVAPSGKLWIERTGPVVGEPGPIDLVTPEGQYLGTITGTALPDAISPGGLAAWIERDEDDVERVVVRRLPANWR
ncbi:MAG TPA: 6-bladed beta-propeller [Longimicrobium sp.]|nr:6-bladed beta-propeller [Longimicrobium sp.]